MHLETNRGWRAQIGIQWLDNDNRLLPWPHVVNWVGDELVDYSCPILEPRLGFTLIGNDVDVSNALTKSVECLESGGPGSAWADPLLFKLHQHWFVRLKRFSQGRGARFNPLGVNIAACLPPVQP